MRRRARFSRRRRIAERRTVGHYFEEKLEEDFAEAVFKALGERVEIDELYEVPLDSNVGRDIQKLIDTGAPLVWKLREESRMEKYIESIAQGIAQLAVIYYFG